MSSSPLSVQMDEVRRRAQSLLSSTGSAQEVKADVQTMAGISLPPSEKYQRVMAEAVLRENTADRSKQEVNFYIHIELVILFSVVKLLNGYQ